MKILSPNTAPVNVGPRRLKLTSRMMPNPPNSRRVMRPSSYGNPHKCDGSPAGRDEAARLFEQDLLAGRLPFTMEQLRHDLGGLDLICSCPLDGHGCHAEVLLRYANPQLARWLDEAITMCRRAATDPVEFQRLGILLQRIRRAL